MDEISQNETEIVYVDSMLKEDAEQRRKQLMRHKIPEERSLLNALLNMTKQELDDIRYNLCVSGASSLKKAELAERLVPEIIKFSHRWLPSALEEQYQAFQHLLKHDGITTEFREDDLRLDYLRGLGFIAAGEQEGRLAWYMPEEIQQEFKKLDSAAYKKAVGTNTEIMRLASGLLFFYGFLNYDQLFHKINTYIEKDERVEFFAFMGIMLNGSCWQSNVVGLEHGMHYYTVIDADKLENEQLNRTKIDFAKLSYSEVYDAGEENYIDATDEYKELAQFFMKEHGFDVLRAADVVGEITILLQNGSPMREVVEFLDTLGVLKDKELADAITPLLIAFNNTLRMWLLKGHTPNELMGNARAQKNNIVSFVPRGAKVGRNDPCPCGSGKKYKKCCLDKDIQKLH